MFILFSRVLLCCRGLGFLGFISHVICFLFIIRRVRISSIFLLRFFVCCSSPLHCGPGRGRLAPDLGKTGFLEITAHTTLPTFYYSLTISKAYS